MTRGTTNRVLGLTAAKLLEKLTASACCPHRPDECDWPHFKVNARQGHEGRGRGTALDSATGQIENSIAAMPYTGGIDDEPHDLRWAGMG